MDGVSLLTWISWSAMSTAKLLRWLQEQTVCVLLESTMTHPCGDQAPPLLAGSQYTQTCWASLF